MNRSLATFTARRGRYRAALAVRQGPLSSRAQLVSCSPTLEQLRSKLTYESRIQTVVLAAEGVDDAALRAVAEDFFGQLESTVAAARRRVEDSQRKLDYWSRTEAGLLEIDDAERTERQRRRLADAVRHQRRHHAGIVSELAFIADTERPWLATEGVQ